MAKIAFNAITKQYAGTAKPAVAPMTKPPIVSDRDWELYGARLRAAYRAWKIGRVEEAWRELEGCRWDLRGWEHRHLCALLMRYQAIRSRDHTLLGARFTPDGRLLTVKRDGVIAERDGRTFELIERKVALEIPGGREGFSA